MRDRDSSEIRAARVATFRHRQLSMGVSRRVAARTAARLGRREISSMEIKYRPTSFKYLPIASCGGDAAIYWRRVTGVPRENARAI
jgi:hypothetical protein